jgi:hypothetical protein
MKLALRLAVLSSPALIAHTDVARLDGQGQVWQADVQIRTLEVTRSRNNVTARVVVYSEKDDEARDARLIILLPLGVGVDHLSPGCTAAAGPSMLPSLRAAVQCELGSIPDRGIREATITTTIPPDAVQKRFAVFVYSNTPDPMPANNYAERTIQ